MKSVQYDTVAKSVVFYPILHLTSASRSQLAADRGVEASQTIFMALSSAVSRSRQGPCWHYPQPLALAVSLVQLHLELGQGADAEGHCPFFFCYYPSNGSGSWSGWQPESLHKASTRSGEVGVKEEGSDSPFRGQVCAGWAWPGSPSLLDSNVPATCRAEQKWELQMSATSFSSVEVIHHSKASVCTASTTALYGTVPRSLRVVS